MQFYDRNIFDEQFSMHYPGAVGHEVTFIGSIVSMLVVWIRSKM